MTDFGEKVRSPQDRLALHERVATAHADARVAAERYVRIRREMRTTMQTSHDLVDRSRAMRDSLRDSITAFVGVLRQDAVSPERTIILVKHAVLASDAVSDTEQRHVVEESVRWAVDAYYAA